MLTTAAIIEVLYELEAVIASVRAAEPKEEVNELLIHSFNKMFLQCPLVANRPENLLLVRLGRYPTGFA